MKNRYRQEETREREERILNEQRSAANPYEAYKVMSSPEHSVFQINTTPRPDYPYISIFSERLESMVHDWKPDRTCHFDFVSGWTRGCFRQTDQGELEFDRPFVNMENI